MLHKATQCYSAIYFLVPRLHHPGLRCIYLSTQIWRVRGVVNELELVRGK